MQRKKQYVMIIFVVFLMVAGGCTRYSTVDVEPTDSPPPRPQATLLAGVSQIDITPPPGMPTAGFSMFSRTCWGVRTKIMARVIYISPPMGNPVVLIQWDLLSGARLVRHRVASMVADKTDVRPGGLMIAGTHTHSGPGNFFDSNLYNSMDSNKGGFCREYFDFLCEQVAGAVIAAYRNRRPAKIASGMIDIPGINTNRSLGAYLQNENVKTEIARTGKEPTALDAVDPAFRMIRVDGLDRDGRYKPMGTFSLFSLHSNTNPKYLGALYSGDVNGFAVRMFEQRVRRDMAARGIKPGWTHGFVHAMGSPLHGDSNPYYPQCEEQKRIENAADQQRLGQRIAEKGYELFKTLGQKLRSNVAVGYRAVELDLQEDYAVDDITIARHPAAGWAGAGGAQGHGKTNFLSRLPFIAPGWPLKEFKTREHGAKRIFMGNLHYLFISKESYPRIAFLQVIQVGDTVLVCVPWEVTLEQGRRFAAHAGEKWKNGGRDGDYLFSTLGCANGYFGYVTTAEEYSVQHYEGASNFYGPNTGRYLERQLGRLAETLAREGTGAFPLLPSEVKLKYRQLYPKKIPPLGNREVYQPPEYHAASSEFEEGYWSFHWYDVLPYFIRLHEPLVRVEVLKDGNRWVPLMADGIPVDDSGFSLSIHFHKSRVNRQKLGLYEVRWYDPPLEAGQRYRFVIMARKAEGVFDFPGLYSSPFGL